MQPGDGLPASTAVLEDRIGEIPEVAMARVEAVCCEGRDVTLFIGVDEKGEPLPALRTPPAGSATPPQGLADTYLQFLGAVTHAAAQGNTGEDLTAGHSMMTDPDARAAQERFAAFAADRRDLALLQNVLRNAAEPDQRATAAVAIGYVPNKQEAVNDLQYAIEDPDASVRATAMRSLKAITVPAAKQPDLGIRVSPAWFILNPAVPRAGTRHLLHPQWHRSPMFVTKTVNCGAVGSEADKGRVYETRDSSAGFRFIEMLHSIVLSDRVQSAEALLTPTDCGGQATLDQIRGSALPDLAEMTRRKTLRYALPPFLPLGRVAGMADAELHQLWENGERETVIRRALSQSGGSRRRRGN